MTKNKRCRDCGYRSVLAGGNVTMRRTDEGVVGYAGLSSCGSVWLCPVCNSKIMARRAIEVGAVLLWAQSQGLVVLWGSLTVRHNAFTSLKNMVKLQTGAWAKITKQRAWTKLNTTVQVEHEHTDEGCAWRCNIGDTGHKPSVRPDHDGGCDFICPRQRDTVDTGAKGRVGYIRAAEITIGDMNGWHPHFHPIILYRGTEDEAQWHADEIVDAWVEAVESLGGEAIRNGGQMLKVIKGVEIWDELSGYVTKSTYDTAKLAMETTWSQGKTGRGRERETRAHWTLLAVIEDGKTQDRMQATKRWLELEEAATGHRAITWSRGLRRMAGLGVEKEDEAVAAEQVGTRDDDVVTITAHGWESLRDQPVVVGLLLDALEIGWAELRGVLEFYGIQYGTVGDFEDVTGDQNETFARDRRFDEHQEWAGRDEPEQEAWAASAGNGPQSEPIVVGARGWFDPNEPLPPTY